MEPAARAGGDTPAPRVYAGVKQIAVGNWSYTVVIDGVERTFSGERTALDAANGYDAVMRAQRCRVVNTRLYPSDVQAVAGEDAATTLLRKSQALKKPNQPPPPPKYKGVERQSSSNNFVATAYVNLTRKRLGVFATELEAARAYDVEMRRQRITVVNFPRFAGEVKAVPDAAAPVARSPPAPPAPPAAWVAELQRPRAAPPAERAKPPAPPSMPVPPLRPLSKRRASVYASQTPAAEVAQPSGPAPAPSPPVPLTAAFAPPPPAPATTPMTLPLLKLKLKRSPVAAAALYKGVQAVDGAFVAIERGGGVYQRRDLGCFETAKAAADAYDARQRELKCPVVNSPMFAGEIKAVRGEKKSTTIKRALEQRSGIASPPPASAQPQPPSPAVAASPVLPAAVPMEQDDEQDEEQPPGFALAPVAKRTADDAALDAAATAGGGDAAHAAQSKRARTFPEAPHADSATSPDVSPAANGEGSADATPVAARAVPAPPAAPAAEAPLSDLGAFLRSIAPPLRDIERVVVAAPGCGLSLASLRDALRRSPEQAAMNLALVCSLLGIHCGRDKLALQMALCRTAGA